jgi:hypothetical protein
MSSNQICNIIRAENLKNHSSNGISCEWDADGWLHVHGTQVGTSSEGVTSKNKPIHLEAGKYVISAEVEGGGLGTYNYVSVWSTDNSKRIGVIINSIGYCALSATKPVDICLWVGAASDGHTVDYRMRIMLVEGDTPAAWAPYSGETLAGGGALMSANLLDGLETQPENGTTAESDGIWHHAARTKADGHDDWLMWDLPGQAALATNQTYHVGLSVRGASANANSLHTTIGYKDAAGKVNWATSSALAVGTSWGRAEATIVVPSGMTPFAFYVAAYGTCPETWMASPTLSLGSPVPLAISSTTLAWSAGIVATTRYYKLASATSSTPAVPTSSSALNGWSETEPTADVTKVMWVCERTVYADGTESWSKASKSTSYEAAKDAKSAANAAKNTADSAKSAADNLKTLIHEGDDGITVGKSTDGKTWSTGRTRMTADSYQILDKLGTVITQLASDGASFLSGLVRIVTGKATLPGNLTVNSITIDSGGGVAVLRGIVSRISANLNGVTSSVSAGWEQDFGHGVTAIVRENAHLESGKMVPERMASTHLASDKAELYVGDNSMKVTGDSFSLSHPEYLRKGLRITQGLKVCHGHGTPWVTLFESWSEFQSTTGCYDSGLPTLVTMNGDWGAFDGSLSDCEIHGGDAVFVMARTTGGPHTLYSSNSVRINWICIW